MSIELLSVNRGLRRTVPGSARHEETGIFKTAVSGPVAVGEGGVEGDQRSPEHQHAPGQALCLYSAEDYRWWERELDRAMPHALFGENLTISSFGEEEPRVGDLWRIGDLVLQLSAPRTPCSTLAQVMGEPGFVKRFARANRGGAYARVVRPGTVRAGDRAVIAERSFHPTLKELFALYYLKEKDRDLMRRALASPLAELNRQEISRWLERAEVRGS